MIDGPEIEIEFTDKYISLTNETLQINAALPQSQQVCS